MTFIFSNNHRILFNKKNSDQLLELTYGNRFTAFLNTKKLYNQQSLSYKIDLEKDVDTDLFTKVEASSIPVVDSFFSFKLQNQIDCFGSKAYTSSTSYKSTLLPLPYGHRHASSTFARELCKKLILMKAMPLPLPYGHRHGASSFAREPLGQGQSISSLVLQSFSYIELLSLYGLFKNQPILIQSFLKKYLSDHSLVRNSILPRDFTTIKVSPLTCLLVNSFRYDSIFFAKREIWEQGSEISKSKRVVNEKQGGDIGSLAKLTTKMPLRSWPFAKQKPSGKRVAKNSYLAKKNKVPTSFTKKEDSLSRIYQNNLCKTTLFVSGKDRAELYIQSFVAFFRKKLNKNKKRSATALPLPLFERHGSKQGVIPNCPKRAKQLTKSINRLQIGELYDVQKKHALAPRNTDTLCPCPCPCPKGMGIASGTSISSERKAMSLPKGFTLLKLSPFKTQGLKYGVGDANPRFATARESMQSWQVALLPINLEPFLKKTISLLKLFIPKIRVWSFTFGSSFLLISMTTILQKQEQKRWLFTLSKSQMPGLFLRSQESSWECFENITLKYLTRKNVWYKHPNRKAFIKDIDCYKDIWYLFFSESWKQQLFYDYTAVFSNLSSIRRKELTITNASKNGHSVSTLKDSKRASKMTLFEKSLRRPWYQIHARIPPKKVDFTKQKKNGVLRLLANRVISPPLGGVKAALFHLKSYKDLVSFQNDSIPSKMSCSVPMPLPEGHGHGHGYKHGAYKAALCTGFAKESEPLPFAKRKPSANELRYDPLYNSQEQGVDVNRRFASTTKDGTLDGKASLCKNDLCTEAKRLQSPIPNKKDSSNNWIALPNDKAKNIFYRLSNFSIDDQAFQEPSQDPGEKDTLKANSLDDEAAELKAVNSFLPSLNSKRTNSDFEKLTDADRFSFLQESNFLDFNDTRSIKDQSIPLQLRKNSRKVNKTFPLLAIANQRFASPGHYPCPYSCPSLLGKGKGNGKDKGKGNDFSYNSLLVKEARSALNPNLLKSTEKLSSYFLYKRNSISSRLMSGYQIPELKDLQLKKEIRKKKVSLPLTATTSFSNNLWLYYHEVIQSTGKFLESPFSFFKGESPTPSEMISIKLPPKRPFYESKIKKWLFCFDIQRKEKTFFSPFWRNKVKLCTPSLLDSTQPLPFTLPRKKGAVQKVKTHTSPLVIQSFVTPRSDVSICPCSCPCPCPCPKGMGMGMGMGKGIGMSMGQIALFPRNSKKNLPYRKISLKEVQEIEPLFEKVNKTFRISPYRFTFKKALFKDYHEYCLWAKDTPVAISIAPSVEEESIKSAPFKNLNSKKVNPFDAPEKQSEEEIAPLFKKKSENFSQNESNSFESSSLFSPAHFTDTEGLTSEALHGDEEKKKEITKFEWLQHCREIEQSVEKRKNFQRFAYPNKKALFSTRLQKKESPCPITFGDKEMTQLIKNRAAQSSPKMIQNLLVGDRKLSFFGITNLFPKRLIAKDQKELSSQILWEEQDRRSISLLEQLKVTKESTDLSKSIALNKNAGVFLETLLKSGSLHSLQKSDGSLFKRKKTALKERIDSLKTVNKDAKKKLNFIRKEGHANFSSFGSKNEMLSLLRTAPRNQESLAFLPYGARQHPVYTYNRRLRLRSPQLLSASQNSTTQSRIDDLNLSQGDRWWQKRRIASSLLGAPSKRYLVMPEITTEEWKKIIEWQLKTYFLEEEKRLQPLILEKNEVKKVDIFSFPFLSNSNNIKKGAEDGQSLMINLLPEGTQAEAFSDKEWAKQSFEKPFSKNKNGITSFSGTSEQEKDLSNLSNLYKNASVSQNEIQSSPVNLDVEMPEGVVDFARESKPWPFDDRKLSGKGVDSTASLCNTNVLAQLNKTKSLFKIKKIAIYLPWTTLKKSLKKPFEWPLTGLGYRSEDGLHLCTALANRKPDLCFVSSISPHFKSRWHPYLPHGHVFANDNTILKRGRTRKSSFSLTKLPGNFSLPRQKHNFVSNPLPPSGKSFEPNAKQTLSDLSPCVLNELSVSRVKSFGQTTKRTNYKGLPDLPTNSSVKSLHETTIYKPFLFEGRSKTSYLLLHQLLLAVSIQHLFKSIYKVFGKIISHKLKNSSLAVFLLPIFFNAASKNSSISFFSHLKTRLKDLIDNEETIASLSELVWYLRNGCRSRHTPRGVVLVETLSSESTEYLKAVGGEAQVPVIVQSLRALPFTQSHPQRRLEKILMFAQKKAPCILFLDDLDSIGQSRTFLLKNNYNHLSSSKSEATSFARSLDFVNSEIVGNSRELVEKRKWSTTPFFVKKSEAFNSRATCQDGIDSPAVTNQRFASAAPCLTRKGLTFSRAKPLGKDMPFFSPEMIVPSPLVSVEPTFKNRFTKKFRANISTRKTSSFLQHKSFVNSYAFKESLSFPDKINKESSKVKNTALGVKKSDLQSDLFHLSDAEKIVEQRRVDLMLRLLTVMDGISHLDRVLIVTTSRNPRSLDPALLRPGRFEKAIHLNLPTKKQRIELLKVETTKIGHTNPIPWEYFGTQTKAMSNTEISSAVNHSAFRAILQSTLHTFPTLEYGINSVNGNKVLGDVHTLSFKSEKNTLCTPLKKKVCMIAFVTSQFDSHPHVFRAKVKGSTSTANSIAKADAKMPDGFCCDPLWCKKVDGYALLAVANKRFASAAPCLSPCVLNGLSFSKAKLLGKGILADAPSERALTFAKRKPSGNQTNNLAFSRSYLWPQQISETLKRFNRQALNWYRLYLPKIEQNLNNREWVLPDRFFNQHLFVLKKHVPISNFKPLNTVSHTKVLQKKNLFADFENNNDFPLKSILVNDAFYSIVLACFYSRFDNCSENREFLDLLADHLIRFKKVTLHEIVRIRAFYF